MKQQTLKQRLSFSGIGIHSGAASSIIIEAADVDQGIRFLHKGQEIPALADKVQNTRRGTTLGGIVMVEHLLAALFGLGIDNAIIRVEGDELPILDGSALPYVEAILAAGTKDLSAENKPCKLPSPLKVENQDGSCLTAEPLDGFEVDFMIKFPVIGVQTYHYSGSADEFVKEIAPARTFGFQDEFEELKKQGLGKGATLENALAIGKGGYLNRPRFADEPVRHKILDLIGDLALLGRPLQAKLTAKMTGHTANIELVRRIQCSI